MVRALTVKKLFSRRKLRSFKQARSYIRNLKLKNQRKFFERCTTIGFPSDIPRNPYTVYKNNGWTCWGDFLGNNEISKKNADKNYVTLQEARKIVKKFKIKTVYEYWRLRKNKLKYRILLPYEPSKYYKLKDYKEFALMGNERPNYLSFEQAKKLAQKLKIKSSMQFREMRRNGKLPREMPSQPEIFFRSN